MKKNIIQSIVISAVTILITGCATQIQETLYLGDAKVNAPITPPPVHMNVNSQPGDVTFSPRFSALNRRNMIASSDEMFDGTVLLPDSTVYRTSNKNIEWNFSRYTFGLDADIKVSKGFALFGGLSFSDDNYSGGNIGIGLFSYLTDPIVRFDIGLNFQNYKYDAVTVVDRTVTDFWGHETKSRYLYHDIGKETNINPFIALMFNSNNDSTLVNYFVNAGYFLQQLLDFQPHNSYYQDPEYTYVSSDKRPDCTAGFIYFNPGISFNMNSQIRILVSAKFLKEVILQLDSGNMIIIPQIQMDFHL